MSRTVKNTARGTARHLHQQATYSLGGLNAFVIRTIDPPREDEKRIKAPVVGKRLVAGVLQGRRIAVKDNICTVDTATTCASGSLHGFSSPVDATVVQRLRNAGARIMEEKTNMDEFGMGSHSTYSHFGYIANPGQDDIEYSPGGSSGGSAMAVATGYCWAALGTDTGGSIRLPAAYTGVFGFKPSYGLVSRNGVVAYANSLDTVGMFANTVFKIPQLLSVMSAYDSKDATTLSTSRRENISKLPKWVADLGRPLRVGIPAEYNISELDDSIRKAWTDVASTMQRAGATVVPISLPSTKSALAAYYVLAPAEASSNLARYDSVRFGARNSDSDITGGTLYSDSRGMFLGSEVKKRILLGNYTLSSEAMNNYFVRAQKVRRLVQRDFDRVFSQRNVLQQHTTDNVDDGVDVILCPTAPTMAPTLDEVASMDSVSARTADIFTVPASLAGLPAISMPVQGSESPESNIGLQLIGQYGCDELLLDAASQLEFQGLVRSVAPSESERMKNMMKSQQSQQPGLFSPELAQHYLHMRRNYGNSLAAVQWTEQKKKK